MSQAIASQSLVSLALPKSGNQRLAAQLALAIGGTLLLTLSAHTSVPFWPVPMTLQTLVVLLIGAAFGMRLGAATLLVYLCEGAAGLPVFQGMPEKGIGLAYMMGPTGGYLVGFLVAAAIVGWAADRGWDRGVMKIAAVMLAADALILVSGFSWLSGSIGVSRAWQFGVLPFIVPEIVKVGIAACLVPAVWGVARAIFAKGK